MAINAEPQVFLFLSEILGQPIIGPEGQSMGKIMDLVATLAEPYPIVTDALLSPEEGQKTALFYRFPGIEEGQRPFKANSVCPDDFRAPFLRDNELLLKELEEMGAEKMARPQTPKPLPE